MMSPCLWMLALIFQGCIQSTFSAKIRCYNSSLSNYTEVELNNPTSLFNSTCFDQELPTLCYTFGYRGKVNGPATTAVLDAYLNTKKRNVLLLDWEEEAQSGTFGIQIGYLFRAVPNAKQVGEELGRGLLVLAENGLNMSSVHLMGHSLGAHLMGHAGRFIRAKGYAVSRITGLDPARHLYEGTLKIQKGLDRTCAKFVDIIHTNPGHYGSSVSTGTVDFWPNFAHNNRGMQPGCPEEKHPIFSKEDLCSHDRAWIYYIESLKFGTAFPSANADSFDSWLEMEGRTNDTIYLGDLVNTRASGNYYLTTNPVAPYNKGPQGSVPGNQARKRRRTYTTKLFQFIGYFR